MARKHNLYTGGQQTEVFARFAGHHPDATIQTVMVMQTIERAKAATGLTPNPEDLVPVLRWDIRLIRHHYRILGHSFLLDQPPSPDLEWARELIPLLESA